jgi:hypothetical protein
MSAAPKPEAAVTILPEHASNPLACSACGDTLELPTTWGVTWRHP